MKDVTNYGCAVDGDPGKGQSNAAGFMACLSDASLSGEPVYIPPGPGMVLAGGLVQVNSPNTMIYGSASQGVKTGSPTSRIIAQGFGDTIQWNAPGGSVRSLTFTQAFPQQTGPDAFLKVSVSQVTAANLFMDSPNIGISLQLPAMAQGEFWIENVLIDGKIGTAGIIGNVGDAALAIRHVIMNSPGGQPPYGILIQSAGELVISGGCDIINCGACLALLPGLGGAQDQWCQAVYVSDSLFDSGNGAGCIVMAPTGNGFIQDANFSNVWTSTGKNVTPTNGFTMVAGNPGSIRNVGLSNCLGQNFANQAGLYANGVIGLSVMGSTFGANLNGIQTYGTSGVVLGCKCGDYILLGGNAAYGLLLENSPLMKASVDLNCLDRNGAGPILVA